MEVSMITTCSHNQSLYVEKKNNLATELAIGNHQYYNIDLRPILKQTEKCSGPPPLGFIRTSETPIYKKNQSAVKVPGSLFRHGCPGWTVCIGKMVIPTAITPY